MITHLLIFLGWNWEDFAGIYAHDALQLLQSFLFLSSQVLDLVNLPSDVNCLLNLNDFLINRLIAFISNFQIVWVTVVLLNYLQDLHFNMP